MGYYRTCPRCGAHLDPGEICTDCWEKEKAVPVLQHQDGGVEQVVTDAVSTSSLYETKEDCQV